MDGTGKSQLDKSHIKLLADDAPEAIFPYTFTLFGKYSAITDPDTIRAVRNILFRAHSHCISLARNRQPIRTILFCFLCSRTRKNFRVIQRELITRKPFREQDPFLNLRVQFFAKDPAKKYREFQVSRCLMKFPYMGRFSFTVIKAFSSNFATFVLSLGTSYLESATKATFSFSFV